MIYIANGRAKTFVAIPFCMEWKQSIVIGTEMGRKVRFIAYLVLISLAKSDVRIHLLWGVGIVGTNVEYKMALHIKSGLQKSNGNERVNTHRAESRKNKVIRMVFVIHTECESA